MQHQDKCDESETLKLAAMIGLALLAFLLLLSGIFYKLRMSFLDGPFMIFQIIEKDSPDIMVQRYGSIITQVWPWLAQKCSLPMNIIMLVYSLSFNMFYFLTGAFLYKIRQYRWVIILAFYQIAFCTDAFFWPNNEIHQGIAWLAATAGLWFFIEHSGVKYMGFRMLLAILLTISLFTHPLMLPVVIFLVILFVLEGVFKLNKREHQFILLFIFLVMAMKFYLSTNNWYDGAKFSILASQSPNKWLQVFNSHAMHSFVQDLFSRHWVAVFIFAVTLWVLIIQRKFPIALFMTIFTLIYLLLVAMAFPDFKRFYIESQWMPIAIFIITPLVFNFHVFENKQRIVFFSLMVCIAWLMLMPGAVSMFQARYTRQMEILNRMETKNISKLILTDVPDQIKEHIILPWALPVESIILSSASNTVGRRSFLFEQPERATKGTSIFLSAFENLDISTLDRRYFWLNNTEDYVVLKYSTFMNE